MKRIIFFVLTFSICATAHSQFRNYDGGGKVKDRMVEKSRLEIKTDQVNKSGKGDESLDAILALGGVLIEGGINVTQKIVEKRKLKWVSQFKVTSSADSFYSDKKIYNLPTLAVVREVRQLDSDSFSSAESFILKSELSSDLTAFRFYIEEVHIQKTRTKTSGKHNFLNVLLQINLKAVVMEDEKLTLKDFGNQTILLDAIKVGEKQIYNQNNRIYSGWFPIIPPGKRKTEVDVDQKEVETEEQDKDGNTVKTTLKTERDLHKVVSYYKNASPYQIEVLVIETNPKKLTNEAAFDYTKESLNIVLELINALQGGDEEEAEE